MDIGIIGYGTVGKAVEYGFKDGCNIFIYDPAYPSNKTYYPDSDGPDPKFLSSIAQVVLNSDFIFVCVPTPMKDINGGPFDSNIIDNVMDEIDEAYKQSKISEIRGYYGPVVIIESAVIPSKIKEYILKYPIMHLVVSPEYLTENEPFKGFVEPLCRILGGDKYDTKAVQRLFDGYSICKPCKVGFCDAIAASVMKYMENSFLALKVTFMNQFYDILKASGSETDWEHFATIFHYDSRMGNSHYHVPGPDGDRAFGGKCFAKDVNAICYDADNMKCDLSIMKEAWKYNLKIRKKINWSATEDKKEK